MKPQKTYHKKPAKKTAMKVLSAMGYLLLGIAALYVFFCYAEIPVIQSLRHMAIETSLSTMNHQWVAYAVFPDSIVEEVAQSVEDARQAQIGIDSTWEQPPKAPAAESDSGEAFFSTFWELDRSSAEQYLSTVSDLSRNDLVIDRSGLDQDGTEMLTIYGDKVLAVDAQNGVLLIRVTGAGYRGVLAIAKDPSRLSVCASAHIGHSGQLIGDIADANNGILAMTASGFEDVDKFGIEGVSTGGVVSGFTRCGGADYGETLGEGFKRVELRKDDLLYIVDSDDPVAEDCTDCAEFTPALIVDGTVLVDENCGWNAINPRACIGQNGRGEIMMLCVEGRQLSSLGIGVVGCAEILSRYGCQQAINLDGGTSAILWYNGKCVTRCSNEDLPEGRTLPNAFVYERKPSA